MKTKIFTFILALTLSTVMFAGNTPSVSPIIPGSVPGVEALQLSIDMNAAQIAEALEQVIGDQPEGLTCTVSATIAIGGDKIFFKSTATVSVTGDCDEVIGMLQKKIAEIREALQ